MGVVYRAEDPKLKRRAALLIPLATFPLVYYVVSQVAHYPAPLAWMLLLLAGCEVQSWISRGSHNHAHPARSAG